MLDTKIRRMRSQEIISAGMMIDPRMSAINMVNINHNNTMNDGDDELSEYMVANSSEKSISLDGILATRDIKVQTLNAYKLTSQMVFADVETKVRELVAEIIKPIDYKQTSTFKQNVDF